MNDTRNTILAVVLSGLILLAWQFLYVAPQEKRRAEQSPQTQVANPPAQSGDTTPAPGASGAPPAAPQINSNAPAPAAAPTQTREAAIAAAPRVKIDTPSISGSISLKGGRIDDLSLKQYHETVDSSSAAI